MTGLYFEGALIERPAIALLGQLGWATVNCFDEVFGDVGRDVPAEPVVTSLTRARSPSRWRAFALAAVSICAGFCGRAAATSSP